MIDKLVCVYVPWLPSMSFLAAKAHTHTSLSIKVHLYFNKILASMIY
jgi:hypothetical protein